MLVNEKFRNLLIPIFIIGLTVISRADVVIDWNVLATNAAPTVRPRRCHTRQGPRQGIIN